MTREGEDKPVPVFLTKEQWKFLDDTLWAVYVSDDYVLLKMSKEELKAKLKEIHENIREVLGET